MAEELPEKLVEDGRVHGDCLQLEVRGGAASLTGSYCGLRHEFTCLRLESHILLGLRW